MASPPHEVFEEYERNLRAYIADPDEARLAKAYETGREALSAGVGLVALADLHGHLLAKVARESEAGSTPAERAADFCIEAIAPYEMAFRGYRDSLRVLQRISDAVLDNLPAVIFTITPDGVILRAQGGGVEATGVELTELEGATVQELSSDLPDLAVIFTAGLKGRPTSGMVHLPQADRYISIDLRPVHDEDGALDLVVGLAIDVTERRRAEQARIENEAKSRFLANLTHELRNPLNIVLGFTELLSSTQAAMLTEQQQRYLDHISRAGELLRSLINDVLDLSKVAAGRMSINVEPVDIDAVIHACVEQMTPLAASRNVAIEKTGRSDLVASADQQRLTQVLTNLLSNAIKFTRPGGRVSVAAACAEGGVRIEVRDTGIGIPADKLEFIFDEFAQIESRGVESPPGTGLGLPLSRRLAELMGGRLEVASRVGTGSTFTLTIPAGR